MSKSIDELFKEACIIENEDTRNFIFTNVEKTFAQLIVEECCQRLYDRDHPLTLEQIAIISELFPEE